MDRKVTELDTYETLERELEKELEAMKQSYSEVNMSGKRVEELKAVIEKGKAENRKERFQKRRNRWMQSAAVIVMVFIILPNTSVSAAYSMEQIPLLGNLVKAVTFRNYEYTSERNQAEVDVAKLEIEDKEEEAERSIQTDRSIHSEVKEQLSESVEEINAEIEKITEDLIAEFETDIQEEMGYQNLVVTSEVIATAKDYFTLKLLCYQGSGSGYQWNYYYTIDLNTGERLQLADIFQKGADYMTPISENIKEQMKAQMEADENAIYWLDSEVPEWDFQSITEETSFYINEAGNIVICFNEGDVAPMYMGVVEFEILDEVVSSIKK